MTLEKVDTLTMLRRAIRVARYDGELLLRWYVGETRHKELLDEAPGGALHTVWGLPIEVDHYAREMPWALITQRLDGTRHMAAAEHLAGQWQPGPPQKAKPTADLSQIAADLEAFAAKQPPKPKPTAGAVADYTLAAAMIDKASAPLAGFAASLKDLFAEPPPLPPAEPLPMFGLHEPLGIVVPGAPLVLPDPDPQALADSAKAVELAAHQIALAFSSGQLPVPPQAHHAKVGDYAVELTVTIRKETPQ